MLLKYVNPNYAKRGNNHTTHAKTNAIANMDPPKPSWNPTATVRAVTVAE